MKLLLFIILCTLTISVSAQQYKYYFIEFRATGKMEVEIAPEAGAYYPDIDSLLISKADTNKKGYRVVTGKKYSSYAEVFDILSGKGLEFVQFAVLNSVGGATAFLLGETLPTSYAIWRRRIE